MSNITMSRQFRRRLDIDSSLKQRAWDFLTKLMADPTSPGLHIEPIRGARDPRVRTGRVNDSYRAVMFLVAQQPEPHFVLAAVAKHDEANALAERLVLTTNPVTGVLEVREEAPPAPPTPTAATPQAASATPAEPDTPVPPAPPGTDSAGSPPLARFTVAELESVGLSRDLARRAVACPDEDALIALAGDERVPPWQGDVLLSLATGTPLAEVLAQLDVSPPAIPDATGTAAPSERAVPPGEAEAGPEPELKPASDAEVAAALDHPSTQMDFVRIETDRELRRVLDGTFAAWRVFLHPEQRRYAYAKTTGAYRLSGGAGTGKTVVALHRARQLATRLGAPRVVLTTFTRTLADNLARDLRILDPSVPQVPLGRSGVAVRGIDQIALDVLAAVPSNLRAEVGGELMAAGTIPRPLSDRDDRAAWIDAARAAGLTGELARPSFLLGEYRMVILAGDLTSRAEYLRIPRPGRGTRLSRAQRADVWKAVEAYRRQMALNQTASFAEIAVLAARCADAHAAAGGGRPADHVIVDEAQDLHPGHWRLLRALVAEGPDDLFIAEDSHQRIYGEKVVLSRYGIAVRGRSRRLTLNYRTTAQNLRFALGILAGAEVTDLEGGPERVAGYRSAMNGPVPALYPCSGLTEELDVAAEHLRGWLAPAPGGSGPAVEPGSLGVLTRSARQRDIVAQGLRDRGIAVQVVAAQDPGHADAPRLMTMHRAKGLEFSRVVLFGVDRHSVPSEQVIAEESADERADRLARERFLLYVAASRARDALAVIWSGEPSPFLPTGRAR